MEKKRNLVGWILCIWFLISAIMLFRFKGVTVLVAIFFLIVSFVFFPKSSQIIEKLFHKEFEKKQKIKTVIFAFIVIVITSFIVSSNLNSCKVYDNSRYASTNSEDFFLSSKDLSTKWTFGDIVHNKDVSIPNLIENKFQYYYKVNGLSMDGIKIYVYKFADFASANSYYTSEIDKIIANRGYTEQSSGCNDCFTISKDSALYTITTSYCKMGQFVVTVEKSKNIGSYDDTPISSILEKIHDLD